MNKAIVIYKSKTGFTKKYAQMIADEINCTLMEFKNITAESIYDFDTIIFGSRAHAGMIDGFKKAKEIFKQSKSKNIVIFVTGATPNNSEEVIREFWQNNLTLEEITYIPHFYMQGGLCYEKMSFFDKTIMKMVAFMMKKKKNKNSSEIAFSQSITSSYDISSSEFIKPLIKHLKEYSNQGNSQLL